MARKARDYKAEYARRNALAKERGFNGYSQYRRKYERGEVRAVAPHRIRSKRTAEAQQNVIDYETELGKISREQQCRDWSNYAAKTWMAKFRPHEAKRRGLTRAQYIDAYYNAFVGEGAYAKSRYRGGNEALRYWFVDVLQCFSADEYDARYVSDK